MSTATVPTDNDPLRSQDGGKQNLTFIVDQEEYGVDILRVQGIQGWSPVTPIPNTPPHVLGVINLRGAVVPVVDLRRRFGLPSIACGKTTVVIIVRVNEAGKERIVGMMVDAVSEIYNVTTKDIQPVPEFGSTVDVRFVRGIATLEEKMVTLLDIDRLLSVEDSLVLSEAMPPGVASGPDRDAAAVEWRKEPAPEGV